MIDCIIISIKKPFARIAFVRIPIRRKPFLKVGNLTHPNGNFLDLDLTTHYRAFSSLTNYTKTTLCEKHNIVQVLHSLCVSICELINVHVIHKILQVNIK